MKKQKIVSLVFGTLLFLSTKLYADTWFVHNYDDVLGEGSLRVQIQSACESPGDDIIKFMDPAGTGPIEIRLGRPLVIPRNCQGRIHVIGHESHETRIVMYSWSSTTITSPEEYCSFTIYSDGNALERLTLYGGESDVCLFGRLNHIHHNTFGHIDGRMYETSAYGVITSRNLSGTDAGMDGSQNLIEENHFLSNATVAIQASSNANVIRLNQIESPRQFGVFISGDSNQVLQNTILQAGEAGVLVQGDEDVLDQNTVQNSRARAVVYEGDSGRILSTVISGTGQEGILYRGRDGQVARNQISNTSGDSVALEGQGLLVDANDITRSSRYGILGKIDESYLNHNQINGVNLSGMSLYGRGLHVASNEVQQSDQDGIVLQGEDGEASENFIHSNGGSGFVISGDKFWLYKNRILANGGCSSKQIFPTPDLKCFASDHANGTGILIEAGSTENKIGGADFDAHANIIQYNNDGGIVIRGGSDTYANFITHNTISNNYGAEPDLDLLGDGITLNDASDVDSGANALLNYIDYLQAFPLVPSPSGDARYWSWGLARSGSHIEMYRVSDEDVMRARTHGGAHVYFGDSEVSERTFRIPPHLNFNSLDDQKVSLISHDSGRNTSEFSLNIDAGRDLDMDGIIDTHEVHEGATTPASRYDLTDTDSDGLPDSVEDQNRNGVCDAGETCAYLADTDRDGLNDWAETHGDAVYNPDRFDTNPFSADSDGDGLSDGQEDRNNNGVWDNDQGESSPHYSDSDNDGIVDGRDNCPSIPNPAQEPWMCVRSL